VHAEALAPVDAAPMARPYRDEFLRYAARATSEDMAPPLQMAAQESDRGNPGT
jgi:hypothetical protein